MCGIYGAYLRAAGHEQNIDELVSSSLELLRHRGPDGYGTWSSDDGRVGLGHVRLSIIDIQSGAQPMASDCGRFVISYNGEIYNYRELRQEIGSESFRTLSDTEVVLRAYQKWGVDCLRRFEGMFAFGIWDKVEQSIFLARDPFGIKPLYWSMVGDNFYFASEIKGLLRTLSARRINPVALNDYFNFQFYLGEETLLDGVQTLDPGSFGIISRTGSFISKKYWKPSYDIVNDKDEAWFVDKARSLFDRSIDLHLRSDVDVGGYISGGLDSSLVAILARKNKNDRNFFGFNGRFCEGAQFDESRYARDVAKANNIELLVADIGEDDFVENIESVIWSLDQPVAGPGSFPQYSVSALASEHVKVVLGGQGGDEIFGGYSRYLLGYLDHLLASRINGDNVTRSVDLADLEDNLGGLKSYKPLMQEFFADGIFSPSNERYWRLVNRANTIKPLLARGILNSDQAFSRFDGIYSGVQINNDEPTFHRMTHFDLKTLLPALLQVEDRMSMAHGLEARVPFLHVPFVEFLSSIPLNIKFKKGKLKSLMHAAFSSVLPDSLVKRTDKMGFPVPLNLWLHRKGKLKEYIGDILGSTSARNRFYLERELNLDQILSGQGAYGRNLWALLSLELWQQSFIDQVVR